MEAGAELKTLAADEESEDDGEEEEAASAEAAAAGGLFASMASRTAVCRELR